MVCFIYFNVRNAFAVLAFVRNPSQCLGLICAFRAFWLDVLMRTRDALKLSLIAQRSGLFVPTTYFVQTPLLVQSL